MNRKILLLNLCLLVLLASLGWMLRARWLDARARESAVLSKAARRTELLPPPTPALPAPALASDYSEVVAKTLFAKDRDPTVIVVVPPPPPPPAPKPEEPIPPRPVYHGQMGFGPQPVALLSIDGKNQKSYQAGDEVGPFKLVAFDHDQIKFEWHGKTLEYKVSELRQTTPGPQSQAAPPPPPPPPAPVAVQSGVPGPVNGNRRDCQPGDTSASGTVKDGYRKVIIFNMMYSVCYWEEAK